MMGKSLKKLIASYNEFSRPGVVCYCFLIIFRSESIVAFVSFTICEEELLLCCKHWIYCTESTVQNNPEPTQSFTKYQFIKQNALHEASTLGFTLLFATTGGSSFCPSPSIILHSFSTSNLETVESVRVHIAEL